MDIAAAVEQSMASPTSTTTPLETSPAASDGSNLAPVGASEPSVDWANLGSSDDEDTSSGVEGLGEDAPPVAAKAEAPVPDTPAVVPPVVTDPVIPPVVTPTTPEAPVAPVKTAEETAAEVAAQVTARHTALEEYYAVPPEMSVQLMTEPEVVLPQMLAKMHAAMENQVVEMMKKFVPQLIEHHTTTGAAQKDAVNTFYTTFPELKGYENQVITISEMYRKLNPNTPLDVAVKAIGKLAKGALGLPDTAVAATNVSGAPVPVATPAFRPAMPGSSAAPIVPSDNVFSQMAQEILEEDLL